MCTPYEEGIFEYKERRSPSPIFFQHHSHYISSIQHHHPTSFLSFSHLSRTFITHHYHPTSSLLPLLIHTPSRQPPFPPRVSTMLCNMSTSRIALAILVILNLGYTVAFWRLECQGTVGLARIDPLMHYSSASEHVHSIKGGSGKSTMLFFPAAIGFSHQSEC